MDVGFAQMNNDQTMQLLEQNPDVSKLIDLFEWRNRKFTGKIMIFLFHNEHLIYDVLLQRDVDH